MSLLLSYIFLLCGRVSPEPSSEILRAPYRSLSCAEHLFCHICTLCGVQASPRLSFLSLFPWRFCFQWTSAVYCFVDVHVAAIDFLIGLCLRRVHYRSRKQRQFDRRHISASKWLPCASTWTSGHSFQDTWQKRLVHFLTTVTWRDVFQTVSVTTAQMSYFAKQLPIVVVILPAISKH